MSKEDIYDSLELVVIIIPIEQLDDIMKVQIKHVAKKVEPLGSQKFEVVLQSINNIIEENKTAIS